MKALNKNDLRSAPPGHGCPRQCPHYSDELGQPLNIREVARLIGCSAWSVRQRHIPQGMPHFRSGPSGRLTFFERQVTAWIVERQKKGGYGG